MIAVTAKMNVKQGSELEFEKNMLDLDGNYGSIATHVADISTN